MKHFISFLGCCCISSVGYTQAVSLDSALSWAARNNPAMKVALLETSRQVVLTRGSADIPKTDVSLLYGQYNSIHKNDNNISIEQAIPFPSVFARQRKLNKELVISSTLNKNVKENSLRYEVAQIFNHLLYLKAKTEVLSQQDSIMRGIASIIAFEFKAGEATLLDKTLADTRVMEIENLQKENEADREIYLDKLRFICHETFTDIEGEFDETIPVIALDSGAITQNSLVGLAAQEVTIAHEQRRLEVARMMPDIRFGYFTQTLIGLQNIGGIDQFFGPNKRFHGFQVGLSIPLWFAPFKSRIKAATLSEMISKEQRLAQESILDQQFHEVQQELIKNINSLLYFNSALKASKVLRNQSKIAFKNGEIDYDGHLSNFQQALTVEQDYLTTLYEFNQNLITLNYLRGFNQN